jgi:hypothetical protein
MSKTDVTRRAARAFVVAPAILVRGALAHSRAATGAIHVDVAPLRANAGDPTATGVERELPGALARSMAGRIPSGGLTVRIEYLTLGPNTGATVHGDSSPDNIIGVAIVSGREIPVRATTSYMSSPIDQTMIEQSNHDRVSALVQAARLLDALGGLN